MQYKTILLSVAILTGLAAKSSAQERWDGFYAGLSLSGQENTAEAGPFDFEQRSASLGAFAGYNRSIQGTNFVWGPEVSLRGFSGEGSTREGAFGKAEHKNGFLFDTRLRMGYATDALFFYGTAGFGVTNGGLRSDDDNGTILNIGTVYGLGAEMAVTDKWSARIEATKHDFGRNNIDFNSRNADSQVDQTTFTLGISRKF